ncbi:MAG TPA: hydantoinase/oxoprolinase family protein [Methylotenera sp.]|nr:hydantoinase/oxoprolinase family protein [Methylotenera sp.]
MDNQIIGWDVGGAHLKAALLDANGILLNVVQVPCALWRGLFELETAIDVVLNIFPHQPLLHAITMTGELVDLFANRQAGVKAISNVMNAKLMGRTLFYAGDINAADARFVTLDEADQHWRHIASANWLASANYIGLQLQQLQQLQTSQHGLLIDIGSTTSDFVLLENNHPTCLGFTDASRMQTEELVYTGVVRTPLMAVAQKVNFKNNVTSVAAEYFATTADVYRLTGDLQAADDMADTADGKDKTELSSARRIARMIGHDVEDTNLDAWIALAHEFKTQQLMRLKAVADKHISRIKNNDQTSKMVIVGAGAGSFLAKEIASLIKIQYVDIAQLIENNIENDLDASLLNLKNTTHWASVCLPAVAVAYLAFKNQKAITPASTNLAFSKT